MADYLIKIAPLEPYTFGSEARFSFQNEKSAADTYFMRSKKIPEQTTVLGMIRYLLLQSEDCLKTDFTYSTEDYSKMERICGAESFSFDKVLKEETIQQDFGYLQKLSPIFLMDGQDSIYIKNPFCNVGTDSFQLMKLTEPVETSAGSIQLPVKGKEGYEAKEGYGSGYLCIKSKDKEQIGKIRSGREFFRSQFITGNRKNGKSKDDALFRRETISMKQGCFGVFISLSDEAKPLPRDTIVHMGTRQSTFQIKMYSVTEKESLEHYAKEFFKGENLTDTWYYCLSDVLPLENWSYNQFGMIQEKTIRNLETKYTADNQIKRYKRSQVQYNLIAAGSVFHNELPKEFDEKAKEQIRMLHKIGYNYIVKMGGL